jgi:amino acid transporter
MPESASEIAYTSAVFPQSVGFATGWTLTFAYLIVCPYEAVAIGQLAAYLFPGLNSWELYAVGGRPVYLPHLLLGTGTTALITVVNCYGIRFSTLFQNLTTFGLLAVFALFSALGFAHGDREFLSPLFADDRGPGGAWRSILAVLPVVPYFLYGFETVPKCAEEAATGFHPRRFLRVMFLALAVVTLFYVTVIAVVALLQPWRELRTTPFATAVAFERALGWRWLVQVMIVGAVLSLLKVYNGNFLAATRLLYAMGRRDLLGGGLGAVDRRRQTPVVAILLVGTAAAAATFLGGAVLVPISEIGSLAIALAWLATSLAYCFGAAGTMTLPGRLVGLAGAAVSVLFAVIVTRSFDR